MQSRILGKQGLRSRSQERQRIKDILYPRTCFSGPVSTVFCSLGSQNYDDDLVWHSVKIFFAMIIHIHKCCSALFMRLAHECFCVRSSLVTVMLLFCVLLSIHSTVWPNGKLSWPLSMLYNCAQTRDKLHKMHAKEVQIIK